MTPAPTSRRLPGILRAERMRTRRTSAGVSRGVAGQEQRGHAARVCCRDRGSRRELVVVIRRVGENFNPRRCMPPCWISGNDHADRHRSRTREDRGRLRANQARRVRDYPDSSVNIVIFLSRQRKGLGRKQ
jgi:hypothetical protein